MGEGARAGGRLTLGRGVTLGPGDQPWGRGGGRGWGSQSWGARGVCVSPGVDEGGKGRRARSSRGRMYPNPA